MNEKNHIEKKKLLGVLFSNHKLIWGVATGIGSGLSKRQQSENETKKRWLTIGKSSIEVGGYNSNAM